MTKPIPFIPTERRASAIIAVAIVLLALHVLTAQTVSNQRLGDMARISEAAYDPNQTSVGKDWTRVGGGQNTKTGFKYGVYERQRADGTIDRVIGFAGTDEFLTDMSQNFKQAWRGPGELPPAQYHEALLVVSREIQNAASENGTTLTITGHSLGGGLSQYTALMTGTEAVVFNSAELGRGTQHQLPVNANSGLITNVQMKGDPVSQDLAGTLGGRTYGRVVQVDPAPGTEGILPEDQLTYEGWRRANAPTSAEKEADRLANGGEPRTGFWGIAADVEDAASDLIYHTPVEAAERRVDYTAARAKDKYARHKIKSMVAAFDQRVLVEENQPPSPETTVSTSPGQSATDITDRGNSGGNTPKEDNQAKGRGGEIDEGYSRYTGPSLRDLVEGREKLGSE